MTVGKLRQEIIELQKEVEDRISNLYCNGYGLGNMTFINNNLKRIIRVSKFIELEHKQKFGRKLSDGGPISTASNTYRLMDGDPVGALEEIIEKVKRKTDAN